MKKGVLVILIMFIGVSLMAQTWNEWFRQRKTQTKYSLLQIAKLQLYLEYVKEGYKIAEKGLTVVGNIKDGDFKLHDLYFDNLSKVKPSVHKYSKVDDIYALQQQIITDCKAQHRNWNNKSSLFTNDERLSLQQQQDKMLSDLSKDMSALEDVLTDGSLQLTDDERIARIDLIYTWVLEKRNWTASTGQKCTLLNAQRQRSINDLNTLKKLY